MLHAALQLEKKKKLHLVVTESRTSKFQLNMAEEEIDINIKPTKAAKDIRKKIQKCFRRHKKWMERHHFMESTP